MSAYTARRFRRVSPSFGKDSNKPALSIKLDYNLPCFPYADCMAEALWLAAAMRYRTAALKQLKSNLVGGSLKE